MKSWCIKDNKTGQFFKVLLSREELEDYLKENPHIIECINCIECDYASSITLE